ncbi:hypothetical protein A0H81_02768 [Grifola frondosa]|uniref:Uncharacterized protein n=1 Tax=Grifola frondosa TaxID=5627 RepID=A0A1C7MKT2_GRIFR|nr:hypothetical protein A0H81_02768 [Grifola frondosa]
MRDRENLPKRCRCFQRLYSSTVDRSLKKHFPDYYRIKIGAGIRREMTKIIVLVCFAYNLANGIGIHSYAYTLYIPLNEAKFKFFFIHFLPYNASATTKSQTQVHIDTTQEHIDTYAAYGIQSFTGRSARATVAVQDIRVLQEATAARSSEVAAEE